MTPAGNGGVTPRSAPLPSEPEHRRRETTQSEAEIAPQRLTALLRLWARQVHHCVG